MKFITLLFALACIASTQFASALNIDELVDKYTMEMPDTKHVIPISQIPQTANNELHRLVPNGRIDSLLVIDLTAIQLNEKKNFLSDFRSIKEDEFNKILLDVKVGDGEELVYTKMFLSKRNNQPDRFFVFAYVIEGKDDSGDSVVPAVLAFYGYIPEINQDAIKITDNSIKIE